MSIIGSFQVFEQAYIMTQGGPVRSTVTTVYYIYENGFQWHKMGYASSVAWALFAHDPGGDAGAMALAGPMGVL